MPSKKHHQVLRCLPLVFIIKPLPQSSCSTPSTICSVVDPLELDFAVSLTLWNKTQTCHWHMAQYKSLQCHSGCVTVGPAGPTKRVYALAVSLKWSRGEKSSIFFLVETKQKIERNIVFRGQEYQEKDFKLSSELTPLRQTAAPLMLQAQSEKLWNSPFFFTDQRGPKQALKKVYKPRPMRSVFEKRWFAM